jgi:hypothetical protein
MIDTALSSVPAAALVNHACIPYLRISEHPGCSRIKKKRKDEFPQEMAGALAILQEARLFR